LVQPEKVPWRRGGPAKRRCHTGVVTIAAKLLVVLGGVLRKSVFGAVVAVALTGVGYAHAADGIVPTKAPPPDTSSPYDWTGWYIGGHLGYGWGNSNFTGPAGISGSLDLFQPFDAFTYNGSYFEGVQAGYNYMFANRVVVGTEADASFPSFQNNAGVSIGNSTTFASPIGSETYSETVLSSGTLRGRIGYAPGQWLFYATGGFAWSYNQLTLTNLTTGTTDMPFLWRLGWAAGAGVEVPIVPHWTARLEYLYTDYGNETVLFGSAGQRFTSDFSLQELRVGVNYQFGANGTESNTAAPAAPDPDNVNFHGQTTFLWQGYPAFRSPYEGAQSLPGNGQGRETSDATLYAGIRLWQGAELWVNPEIDQGFGLADTLGVAGFTSGEAYKVGFDYPYARLPRAFIRQTINLGGDTQKVESGINQFAESETANRIVITIGKFGVPDIFDNNKYAHDPRNDFMNWALVDTGTFDYAADSWGYTYGAAIEWYQGNWTLRSGLFDLSVIPNSPDLDPTFDQFQWVGEIERRYELWGEPGKLAVTGFLTRGRMGSFEDAIALAEATDTPADIAAVRRYQSRGGISMNLEQAITPDVGAFLRAGWADGNEEPFEFTDVDRTIAGGLSINGKQWGRPDDTVGIAGVINDISKIHQEFLNDGGLGILVGDGMLPNPGFEQILETYYSYAINAATKVSFDYQFVVNPGYNTDRGPVNVFSGRFHWQF
jgi:high affinity Mn2+ porin